MIGLFWENECQNAFQLTQKWQSFPFFVQKITKTEPKLDPKIGLKILFLA